VLPERNQLLGFFSNTVTCPSCAQPLISSIEMEVPFSEICQREEPSVARRSVQPWDPSVNLPRHGPRVCLGRLLRAACRRDRSRRRHRTPRIRRGCDLRHAPPVANCGSERIQAPARHRGAPSQRTITRAYGPLILCDLIQFLEFGVLSQFFPKPKRVHHRGIGQWSGRGREKAVHRVMRCLFRSCRVRDAAGRQLRDPGLETEYLPKEPIHETKIDP